MAIARTATAEDKTTATTTLTYAFDCAGGDFLYVPFTTLSNTHTITSVKYAGVDLTALQTQAVAFSSTWRHHGYYLVNPTSGSNNVEIVCSSINFSIRSGCVAYSGVNTSNPIVTSGKYDSDGSGNTVQVSLTTAEDAWWIISGANPDAPFVAGTITDNLIVSYSGLCDISDSDNNVSAQTANADMSFTGTREGGAVAFALRPQAATNTGNFFSFF